MIEIQRLNMDNSWFININGTRILIDPWLLGAEVDFFPWFNKQWHRTPPIDLEQVPTFDWVLITQKYPDHFHPETLNQLPIKRMVVPKSIEKKAKKVLPQVEIINFNNGLPMLFGSSVNLHFLPSKRRIDPIYDALILEDGEHSVFIASHGFSLDELQKEWVKTLPPFELLIAPFNLFELPKILGGTVSPGIESVKKLRQETQSKKVVATHDEDKHAEGIVIKLAKVTKAPNPKELQQAHLLGDHFLHVDHYDLMVLTN